MLSSNDINPYILLVAIICLILFAYGSYIRKRLQWWMAISRLPGPSYIQLIRFMWKLLFRSENLTATFQSFLAPHFKKYPLIGLGAGSTSVVLLCKAEAVKVLLSSKTQLDKASLYKHVMGLLGDGLATSKGTKWYQLRRLITPSFHVEMLENYLVVMNEQANTLVHQLEEKSKEANGTAFDICPYLSCCAADIICETVMGQRLNAQKKNSSEYFTAVESVVKYWRRRFRFPWLWFDQIYQFTQTSKQESKTLDIVDGFTNEVVKNKIRQLAESQMANAPKNQLSVDVLGKKRRLNMLDILMEMSVADNSGGSKPVTDEDIRDEVKTFLFSGSDTSFSSVSWALYHIGRNPNVQQKIVDELDLIYGDSDRSSSSDDLNNLKYLECVIKETLRLNPPAPVIGRRLTEEMKICGYAIPADTDVFISLYLLHRDPAHFPDPETFDPDRFLPENSQGRDPFAYIPFAAGLRNCIGQKYAMLEVKLILAAILRRFKVKVLTPDQALKSVVIFIGNPMDGVWIQSEIRKI